MMEAVDGLGAFKVVPLQSNTTEGSSKMLALLSVEWPYPSIKVFKNPFSPPIYDTLEDS